MPRRAGRATAAAACILLAAAATAAERAPPVGRYACTASAAAGLQGKGGRYAGRIELPAAEHQFRVQVRRLSAKRPGCGKADRSGRTGPGGHEGWWQCGAALELELPRAKYAQPLRSDDGYIFLDRLSGWFHLAEDLRYVFAYTDFAGNYFVEEGACERD